MKNSNDDDAEDSDDEGAEDDYTPKKTKRYDTLSQHKIKDKDLLQCTSSVIFHHPFTMIVAGPTRSGKTTWVARLLQNRRK